MPVTATLSAGSHNKTPPSSSVTHERSTSQHLSDKVEAKVGGAAAQVKGKLRGDDEAGNSGRVQPSD
ncbi:hypothetical protein JCM10213v2_007168 [Rhodosporidiobolus nylandii]